MAGIKAREPSSSKQGAETRGSVRRIAIPAAGERTDPGVLQARLVDLSTERAALMSELSLIDAMMLAHAGREVGRLNGSEKARNMRKAIV